MSYIVILMDSCLLITYNNVIQAKKFKQGFLRTVTNFKLVQVKYEIVTFLFDEKSSVVINFQTTLS